MARFCPSRGFILDLGGWGFAVPFYFVQDCRKRFKTSRSGQNFPRPTNFEEPFFTPSFCIPRIYTEVVMF